MTIDIISFDSVRESIQSNPEVKAGYDALKVEVTKEFISNFLALRQSGIHFHETLASVITDPRPKR
jgi:hypothetical protein